MHNFTQLFASGKLKSIFYVYVAEVTFYHTLKYIFYHIHVDSSFQNVKNFISIIQEGVSVNTIPRETSVRDVSLVTMVTLRMAPNMTVSPAPALTVAPVYSCITGTSCVPTVRRGTVVRVTFCYRATYIFWSIYNISLGVGNIYDFFLKQFKKKKEKNP